MDKVFLVWATCGEYSDREDWDVACYPDEETALQHARLANEYEKGKPWYEAPGGGWAPARAYLGGSPYDEERSSHDVGRKASYGVSEVALVRHVDEYTEKFTRQ